MIGIYKTINYYTKEKEKHHFFFQINLKILEKLIHGDKIWKF